MSCWQLISPRRCGTALLLWTGLAKLAVADVAPFRPLTFWLPERNSPSSTAIIVAGLAISAATVAMGVLGTRRANQSPRRRSLVLGFVVAAVAVVLLLTAQFYWELILNRYRGPNRPDLNRPATLHPKPAPPTVAADSVQ
jgi:MFS family permease